MHHYLLIYDYVDDYPERRKAFRAAHLTYARPFAERGELFLGGAYAEPPYGGVLVFKTDSPATVETFAKNDPYVTNGVVAAWRVREWVTVIGRDAIAPVAV